MLFSDLWCAGFAVVVCSFQVTGLRVVFPGFLFVGFWFDYSYGLVVRLWVIAMVFDLRMRGVTIR